MRHSEETDVVIEGTNFRNDPEDGMQFTDTHHLGCKLDDQDEDTIADFHDNISDSLELRGYKNNEMCQMSNEELRNLLSQCLHRRRKIKQVRNMLQLEEVKLQNGCVPLDIIVICLLHLETRTSEKLVQEMVKAGLHLIEPCKRETLLEQMEKVMKEEGGVTYKFPFKKEEMEINDVSFDNETARKVCGSLHLALPLCHERMEVSKQQEFIQALKMFNSMIAVLRERSHFSREKITLVQEQIDIFLISGGS